MEPRAPGSPWTTTLGYGTQLKQGVQTATVQQTAPPSCALVDIFHLPLCASTAAPSAGNASRMAAMASPNLMNRSPSMQGALVPYAQGALVPYSPSG